MSDDEGGCCVPESDMMVVRDMNLSAPYKGGNQFARICPDCGTRKFTSRRYFETSDTKYVIPKGEDEPKEMFDCPYPDCDETFAGMMDECPECGQEIQWED